MKPWLLLAALMLPACEPRPNDTAVTPPTAEARTSKPPAVVPKPTDQAELDRMILAGFTPHADHLHPPGVNECPLSKGTDVVM